MEDAFHAQRSGELLSARLHFHNVESMCRFRSHMRAPRMATLLQQISMNSGQPHSFETVMCGALSNAFSILEVNDADAIASIDHRYVGGVLFLRMLEAVLDVPSRMLPHASTFMGIWCTVRHWWTLVRTLARPNTVASSPKTSLSKAYNLPRLAKTSRRFQVYHAFLTDAFTALQRDTLVVGFTIPFEGGLSVNNVGVVILHVHATMDAADLEAHFHKRAGTAMATNALGRLGGYIPWMRHGGGRFLRERMDVMCTALVVDASDVKVDVFVRAGARVYEGVYAFLFSTLEDDTRLCATVTTNHAGQRWSEMGFA